MVFDGAVVLVIIKQPACLRLSRTLMDYEMMKKKYSGVLLLFLVLRQRWLRHGDYRSAVFAKVGKTDGRLIAKG